MNQETLNFSGEKLKLKREAVNKTKAEIASFLEIAPSSYGEMEKGDIKPNSNNLAKLCIYFDCPIQDFFDIPENFFAKV